MDFSFFGGLLEEEQGRTQAEAVPEGYRNIWVVAETEHAAAAAPSLEAVAQARELADQIGVYVYGVTLDCCAEGVGRQLIASGADRVLAVDDPRLDTYQPERWTEALTDLVERYRPEILLMAATSLGNDLAPRLAQRIETGLISNCVRLELDMSERLLLGTFGALGGEVCHTMACPDARPQMATLVPGRFRAPILDAHRSGDVQAVEVDLDEVPEPLSWTAAEVTCERPAPSLSQARVVVAGGRGMGDAEGFALVRRLADALGGVVAGSRGALDCGWIGEEQVVGAGGAWVRPDLYVACGISGDIYHTFGIQDAKFVVAINADAKAPIMRAANMAVVGDARQIIPAMLAALGR